MLVKCKCCGNKIERESAYKVMTDKGNKYYCSKAEYEAMQKEKADKDAIYTEIVDIFGYKIQNSALFKEWKCWNELASNEKILSYIQENKDYIKGAVGKLNSTEYVRVRYMSAILKNSLVDYKVGSRKEPEKIEVKNDSFFELFEPIKESKKMRKSFAELEDDL
mgnify:CR=1 FL=1